VRRLIAFGLGMAVALAPVAQVALADVSPEEEAIQVPPPREVVPEPPVTQAVPVTAPPPAFVELQRSSIGAGLGVSWGKGSLSFEGNNYAFSVKGVSVGDVGLAKMIAEGQVANLERLSDFAGTYVAVEAGATAGKGAGTLTMMNENGVSVTLASQREGLGLTLGAQGFSVTLD
jgi:outer membrane immunogenic protein